VERYLHAIRAIPELSRDEERQFAQSVRTSHDLAAARALVLANLRHVVPIARRYVGPELPLTDLVQEGNVALLKSVSRFDPGSETRLAEFAAPMIQASIAAYASRHPADLDSLPADPEHAANDTEFGTPDDAWLRATRLAAEGDFANDYIESEHDRYRLTQLRQLLPLLDDRTRDIVMRRWLAPGRKAKLCELAHDHGISTQRVRQIQDRALTRLRQRLRLTAR
jgi:RNA polymerase sigma-32 factor